MAMSRFAINCSRLAPLLRKRVITGVAGLLLVGLLVFSLFGPTAFQEGRFFDFTPTTVSRSQDSQPHFLPALRHFKKVQDKDIFLYSAIANTREPVPGELNIIISAFDSTETDSIQCCVMMGDKTMFTTPATIFIKYYIENILPSILEKFKNAPTKGKQYACVVPQLGFSVSHVTLTVSTCPVSLDAYLPVIVPQSVPGGLALCAKAAFGDQLDPHKLMEWFEVQRLLGVDHIQLMDLNNPAPVQKVFKYYTDMGLLNALPYELPGRPYNRGLDQPHWVPQQASHDETFPILECTQRLRGYTYVMGHDIDEVIVPGKQHGIKDMLKEQLMRKPDAAGFYFYTQFFVYDWGPSNTGSDLTLLRYLNSTLPRNECKKYVYLMSRVIHARTHDFTARSPYQAYFVPMEDAILHHYRICPHVWSTCDQPKMKDGSMLRFSAMLKERVHQAREATGMWPQPKT